MYRKYGGIYEVGYWGYLQGEYLKVLYTDFYILPVSYKRGKYGIPYIELCLIYRILCYVLYIELYLIYCIIRYIEHYLIYHNIFMVIEYYLQGVPCMCHTPPMFPIYTWLSQNIRYTLKVHFPHVATHFPRIAGEYFIFSIYKVYYTQPTIYILHVKYDFVKYNLHTPTK